MDVNRYAIAKPLTTISLYPKVELSDDQTSVHVVVRGDGNRAYQTYCYMIMGSNIPLDALKIDYCQRTGHPFNSVRFITKGEVIEPGETVITLKFEGVEVINVIPYEENEVKAGTEMTLISLPRARGEMPITLKVGKEGEDNLMSVYLIGRDTPLRNLFLDYTNRAFRYYESTKFYTATRRYLINPEKTADDLRLADGAILYVDF